MPSLTETYFASGSVDGSIAVYHSQSLSCVSKLTNPVPPSKSRLKSKIPITHSVTQLFTISPIHLMALSKKRFQIFDLETPDKKMVLEGDFLEERNSIFTGIIPLYSCSRFITSSHDGNICLWSLQRNDPPSLTNSQDTKNTLIKYTRNTNYSKPDHQVKIHPHLHSEMKVHVGNINHLIPLSDNSFATCGEDGNLILWKV